MQSLVSCATPSFPPSFQSHHIPNLLQINNLTYQHLIKQLNPISRRTKSTLPLFNLCLQLYVNAGATEEAWRLFNEMPVRTLISWTILMAGYVQHGPAFKAFLMFLDMLFDHDKNKVMPDSFVLSVVLRACA